MVWLPDTALETIAVQLPLNALTQLCATSKECHALLAKLLRKKTREHAPHHIARLVIEARKRLPSGPYRMEVRGALQLKFTERVPDGEANTSILFTAEVNQEGKAEIGAAYAQSDGEWSQSVGYIRAEITPSNERPITAGRVTLVSWNAPERQIAYSDGFDPARALEWFPLDLSA